MAESFDFWDASRPVVTLGSSLAFAFWDASRPVVQFGAAAPAGPDTFLALVLNQALPLALSIEIESGPFLNPETPRRHYPLSLVELTTP